MLNTFRKGGVIQFVMGGVVLLIIAAFALDVRGPSATNLDTECAVRVGDRCVAPRDFTAAFQLWIGQDMTAKELRRLGVRKLILDGLVERELLLEEADRLGISISDEEVDAELALGRFHFSLPAERDGQLPMLRYFSVRHPKTEAFNYEIYQRTVRNFARMSTKDFKNYQTDELIASRMRDLAKLGARVSEAEAIEQFEYESAKATARVAQLDQDWFGRFATNVTDEAVREYLAAHQAEIDAAFAGREGDFVENCPLVSEILFAYPPAADEADEKATRARAERVAAEAAQGKTSFEALARIHSGAPSASLGGKRGCLIVAQGDEEGAELAKAVESLQPGQTSRLVTTSQGIYLLRLEQRVSKEQAGDVGRLSLARPMAVREAALAATKKFAEALEARLEADVPMQDALDQLTRDTLKQSPLSGPLGSKMGALEAAALEARDRPQVEVSPSFSRAGVTSPVPNALTGAAVKQLAFDLKQVGDVHPEPIETTDGLAVLQLKEKEPAKREDFEKNKAEYLAELEARAATLALSEFVARLRQEREGEIQISERFLDPKTDARDDT